MFIILVRVSANVGRFGVILDPKHLAVYPNFFIESYNCNCIEFKHKQNITIFPLKNHISRLKIPTIIIAKLTVYPIRYCIGFIFTKYLKSIPIY